MMLPRSLDWMEHSPSGREWLVHLPDSLDACTERWQLTLGEPYEGFYVSLAVPAVGPDGIGMVLKIQYPHRESTMEADALGCWDGNGAIRLIDNHEERNALLLERCDPGHHLSTAGPDTGLRVLAGLLPRLWVTATEPFNTLADEAAGWVANLPGAYEEAGEPFERILLDEVIAILPELASSQGEQVLLHQDLHGNNVLRSQREPWLVIDPKPLVGEREFGLSPIIRSAVFGHSKESVLHRLNRLTGELGLDRDRARLWAAGQAVAWGFENGKVFPDHIETARWLLAG